MDMLSTELKVRRGASNYIPKQRVTIEPFKRRPEPPSDFEQKALETLTEAVNRIHRKVPIGFSREELYRLVESLCIHEKASKLYSCLHDLCKQFVQQQVRSLGGESINKGIGGKLEVGAVAVAVTQQDEKILMKASSIWQDHRKQMNAIRSIFLYLDRSYVVSHPRLTSLKGMGLSLLRTTLTSQHPEVLRDIVRAVLSYIKRDRSRKDKVTADTVLLKSVLDMLSHLEIYVQEFEGVFLKATKEFYAYEGQRFAMVKGVPAYMKHISERLIEENKRVEDYLAESTRKPLLKALEEALIASHVDTIVRRGVDELVEKYATEDLARMYHLLSRVDALASLKKYFLDHLKVAGRNLVMMGDESQVLKDKQPGERLNPHEIKLIEQEEKKVIPELLMYKKRLDKLVHDAFENDQNFTYALKQGFEYFVGSADYRVAELLSRHVDALLRGAKARTLTTEAQVNEIFNPLLALFGFVQSKDVFKGFYQKELATRLLTGKSASRNVEKIMLQKLRALCGAAFTKHMESMFGDISLSEDLAREFHRSGSSSSVAHQSGTQLSIDFSVRVLTEGSWPKSDDNGNMQSISLNLPQEIKDSQASFEAFYAKRHKNRKLVWQYPRCEALITAEFPICGKKELKVNAFQAVVLAQMSNKTEAMNFAALSSATGLDSKNLQESLYSLLDSKIILKAGSHHRKILPTDTFVANGGFKTHLRVLKLNRERPKIRRRMERKQVQEQVLADRGSVLDATIVRIMKTMKTMAHKDLMADVVKLIKFTCTAQDIKKQIDALLRREYIERDENNPEIYNYKA